MFSYLLITFYWIWWIILGLWHLWVAMFRTSSVELVMLCFRLWVDVGLMYWPDILLNTYYILNLAVLNTCSMESSCVQHFDLLSCVMVDDIYYYSILWTRLSIIPNVLQFVNHAYFFFPTGTTEKTNLVIDVETKWECHVYIFVKQMTQLVKKVSLL